MDCELCKNIHDQLKYDLTLFFILFLYKSVFFLREGGGGSEMIMKLSVLSLMTLSYWKLTMFISNTEVCNVTNVKCKFTHLYMYTGSTPVCFILEFFL